MSVGASLSLCATAVPTLSSLSSLPTVGTLPALSRKLTLPKVKPCVPANVSAVNCVSKPTTAPVYPFASSPVELTIVSVDAMSLGPALVYP